MKQGLPILFLSIALCGAIAGAQASTPTRPDLNTAAPIATCKLQTLPASAQPAYERTAVVYSLQPPADDPLANYERTPLGDWHMPAEADRSDPWLRLLLLAPKRPIVIDVAVLVDGKSFRETREAWVDEVLAAAKAPGAAETTDRNKSADESGTNTTAKASEDGPPSAENDEPQNEGKETQPSGVATQSRQAPTMRDRLINYVTTNGEEVGREEIHWLIAEWGAGPSVVLLSAGLSWQRASMAPLLAHLDHDADGNLSAGEIAQAHDALKRIDFSGDDVVEVSELRRATSRPATSTRASGHSLVVMLDENTDWDALAASVGQVYSRASNGAADTQAPAAIALTDRVARGDSSLDGQQISALCGETADVTLRVDFAAATDDAKQTSQLSVLSLGPALSENADAIVTTSDVISVDVGGDFIEFSAAQPQGTDSAGADVSQLAIGAVVDGNPLERLLDRDQDGRFTLRERQELGGLLAALDQNQDGQLVSDEIPTPIRLAIMLGPRVHQLLATPTGSARTITPRDAAPTPPDWFVSMDKNSDRDLSRNEFLGTTEQFRQFDMDADGLLSVAEALKLSGEQ